MSDQPKRSELVKIAALWNGITKNDEPFLSGYLGGAKLLIFKNKFKEAENQPDWIAYVANKQPKEQQDVADTAVDEAVRSGSTDGAPDNYDEIPF